MRLLENKRVFIVEDDIANMAVYSVMLRQQGAMVIQDHWNASTMYLLEKHGPVDIILLDLMLRNGVSGYDIFATIRQEERLQAVPVVAVSASDPSIEIPRAKAKGFDGFISKPIQMSHFPKQIKRIINGESLWLSQSYQTY